MKRVIVCFSLCTVVCHQAQSQNMDIDLLRKFNARNPTGQTYWLQTSNSVYYAAPTITAGSLAYGLIYKDKQAIKNSFESALSIGICLAVSGGVKSLVNRERPAQRYPDLINSSTESYGKSFPSGHTTLAFATATTLSLQYKKWYVTVPAFAWAASVGYSRMRLGRHYPTDVAAGALVGIGSGYLSHWLTKKIFK
ncbi:phosphatase PAP2 family protein [Taibaiella koreensis]|uniref:phosphatase PAP2 family protein n=1 Tax=Taibaiella koreensis TaxID=1268548 RepID=UPI000E59BF11|nr:phosphatase PAP2 family protein [Taibaiella koreensis]